MAHLVLTTVGTSALTNTYVDNLRNGQLKGWAKEGDRYFQEDREKARKLGEEIVVLWSRVKAAGSLVPAEISSLARIISYFELRPGDGSRFVFISSQTAQGKSAGWAVVHAFRSIFTPCSCVPNAEGLCQHIYWEYLRDLQHRDHIRFVEGARRLQELIIRERASFLQTYPDAEDRLVFNMTGSYKGLVPFATEYCMAYKLKMAYLYEESERLVFKFPETASPIPEPQL